MSVIAWIGVAAVVVALLVFVLRGPDLGGKSGGESGGPEGPFFSDGPSGGV